MNNSYISNMNEKTADYRVSIHTLKRLPSKNQLRMKIEEAEQLLELLNEQLDEHLERGFPQSVAMNLVEHFDGGCAEIISLHSTPGIYAIRHKKKDQYVYVGESERLAHRFMDHINCCNSAKVSELNSLYTWMKDNGYVFVLLEQGDDKSQYTNKKYRLARERHWVDTIRKQGHTLFNK